jgi:hypothetical protein
MLVSDIAVTLLSTSEQANAGNQRPYFAKIPGMRQSAQ